MEKKYYTPTIEEFRIGFEFEWFIGMDKEWCRTIIQNGHQLASWALYKDREFRAKYLDSEDIESLGFKKIDNEYFRIGDHLLQLLGDSNIRMFPSGDDDYFDEWEAYVIFHGKIKNKSELIILLKQLGIS